MEQTIVNAFIESIQTILRDSVAKMTEEARKFTLVVTTMGRLSPVASTASTASTATPGPGPSGASLDQRVHVLETTILERTQRMLHGVMEDISELHSRVDKIQNPSPPSWDNDNDDFPIPWFDRQPFTFHAPRNEIVHETPAENIRTLHVSQPALPVNSQVEEPEENKAEEPDAEEPEEPEEADEPDAEEPDAEENKPGENKPEEAEENKEEEEEEEELEEFMHQGKKYYKDTDNNVYVEDEEGNIDSTPVGRWIEAKNTIKFFPK